VSSLLAGIGELTLADADIDMLIGIAVGDMAARDRSRVRIERLTPTRTIWVDMGLMRLALRNLLANALAFSPKEDEVVVRVSESDTPLALMIDVIDRGRGFDAKVLPRAFERGARGVVGERRVGHGLGLYIVRRAMELQGGNAMLLETGPSGTTMRLQINESSEAVENDGTAQGTAD
jgi:two-component system, OmpR family, sensor kinase